MRITSIASCLFAFVLAFSAGAYEAAAQENDVGMDDTTEYVVTEIEWMPRMYVGVRDTIAMDAVSGFFGTHLPSIFGAVQSKGMMVNGPATGLYYLWDEENMRTALAAVVPVEQAEEADFEDYEVIEIPSGKALVVDYFGHYDDMMSAHLAFADYIAQHEMGEPTVVVEEYITDPEAEPDTSKWQTRIIYVFAD